MKRRRKRILLREENDVYYLNLNSPLKVEEDLVDVSLPKPEEKVGEEDDDHPRGFARGLEPEAILGASNEPGEILFLVKWKNCKEEDFVRAKEANIKMPQTVIKFYEEHTVMGKEYDYDL